MPAISSIHPGVVAAVIVAVFALAALAAWSGRRLIGASLTAQGVADPDIREAMQVRARQLLRGVKLLAYGSASLASAVLVLSFFKTSLPAWLPRTRDDLLNLLVERGLRIGIIVLAAYITVRAIHLWIGYFEYRFTSEATGPAGQERRRRARTLSGTLASLFTVAIAFSAGLMVLQQLSIDVLPILTGAGIAGLAIGFGAQNLVRDVISGFFLILEDQVRVGDLARINGVSGTVEQINLRTIVLRDSDGAVQVFPNGTITALANLSKQFAYATVDVKVAYTENLDRVIGTIREVGAAMQHDAVFGPLVTAPIEVLAVQSLGDGVAVLGVKFRTLPLAQGKVGNELRRRLMTTLVARGIRPYAG